MSTYDKFGGHGKKHRDMPENADDMTMDEDLKALTNPSYQELEAQLNEAENKLNEALTAAEESKQQALRAQAEVENIRKRAEKDVSNAHKFGVERLVNDLLPVIDSLERGLSIEVGNNELALKMREGLEMTLNLLLSTLEKFAVKPVNPLNEAFDPGLHQAISAEDRAGIPSNQVLQVLQKGYLLNDRLIRPALVIVSK